MKVSIPFFAAFLMLISIFSSAQFQWPGGKKAAVVFTYDDGLDCHLDVAIPQLDEYGFKGTFYCTGNSPSLFNRLDEWRQIAKNGHELGNHTLFHPCDGQKLDWVKPEYDLNRYTLEQIVAELKTANTLLKAIDGKTNRTFGYTCSNFVAGGIDFTKNVKELFVAARCDGPVPKTMQNYDTGKTPSWCVDSHSAKELIAYVEEAKKNGTIAVFMFHSVGGGYLNVGAEEHRRLLEYIKKNEKDFYTGSFIEVMSYIQKKQ